MGNSNDELEQFGPYIKKPESKLKNSFGTIVGTILVGLFYVFCAYAEFGGIYHAWKKHNDAVLALFIPPLAWYRAGEAFWHNDFAGVNWEIKLKEDAKACIYFLKASSEQSTNPHEFNKGIEMFSKEINIYPKDKLEILKTLSKLFSEFYSTIYEDFGRAAKNYFSLEQGEVSHSGKILEVESKLKQYLPKEFFEQLIMETEIAYKEFLQQLIQTNSLNDTQKTNFLMNFEIAKNISQSNISSAYKRIFSEDL